MIAATPHKPKPRTAGEDPMLRVSEVAQALNIGRSAAYDLINGGHLPRVTIGRSIRVWKSDLDAYAKRNTSRPS